MYSTCTTIEEIRGIRHPSETDMRGGQSYRGRKKSGERDRTKLFGSRTESVKSPDGKVYVTDS